MFPYSEDNPILEPYKPTGFEYIKDTANEFSGVFIYKGWNPTRYIESATNLVILDIVETRVVDNATQAMSRLNNETIMNRKWHGTKYIIVLIPIQREKIYNREEDEIGFRYEKWGGYIGEAETESEYFFSDPNEKLKQIYIYTIYEVMETS